MNDWIGIFSEFFSILDHSVLVPASVRKHVRRNERFRGIWYSAQNLNFSSVRISFLKIVKYF